MVVIAHEDECVQSPTVHLHAAAEPVEAFLSVGIVPHKVLPLIAARDRGVQRSREFDS
jgi:hypothetical protein